MIRTRLTALLGIDHPVLLAPMGAVSGGRLAAAVTRAGGLGIIGGGYADPAWLEREVREAGNAPVGIGFITWALTASPAALAAALACAPRAIFLSFGDMRPFVDAIRGAGALLIAQVQSVAQAREAVSLGAQVIVAQGTEAGGHGGLRATLPLVPAVVDVAGDVPVVAAGGIADGRGLAAALMLGAAGVLCGTVFYASEESLADPAAKRALVAGSGDATLRARIFDTVRGYDWPPAWALRTLANEFSGRWADDPEGLRARLPEERRTYEAARDAGDFSTAAVIAGEAADLVRAVRPAAEIVADIVAEAEALLRHAPGFTR